MPSSKTKKGKHAKAKAPAKKQAAAATRKNAKPAKKAVSHSSARPVKKISPTGKKTAAGPHKSVRPNGSRNDFTGINSGEKILPGKNHKQRRLDPFVKSQKEKLLQLRDAMVDSMAGVAQDTLRSRAEGSEASAFGMHQADAGSDAYDRDFALSLLSQEQDALYEIDQALKRIELGTYGVCEMSGKAISRARLEAIPFARFTVECQSQLEKQNKASRVRQSVTSLFGLTDEEAGEGEEEEVKTEDSKE
jgi:RNA polymerase-binding transcription factor DksA